MPDTSLIVLAASKMRVDYASIFNTVPAMLPFNGKPLIYQIIINFIKTQSGRPSIFLALPAGEEHIEKFLRVAFDSRADLHCCYISNARPHCQAATLAEIFNQMRSLNFKNSKRI